RLASIRNDTSVRNLIITDISDHIGFPFKKLVERQLKTGGQMADVPPSHEAYGLFDLIKSAQPTPPQVNIEPDDVALFQYTGGTTGLPKAAMLTHRNITSNVLQLSRWLPAFEYGKEKVMGAIPFFHVYGMTVCMGMGIHSGSEIIVVPDPRNIEHVMEVIHREKCSIFPGVPAMYIGIINHAKVTSYDLKSIKACVSGAAPLPMEVQQKFGEITGGRLVEGYGLTEASPVTHANPIYGTRKNGSIGIPMPDVDCAIVALEPDEKGHYPLMPVGEEGEMVVKGPQVMKGYWNRPDETAESIDKEGWLHTGDIARMDEDGYFYIVDRKKDLIIAGGYNIVPREVEEVLFAYPKVEEAVVAGIPNAKRGETVKAYLVLKQGQTATSEEIIDYCRENLAPYKVPKLVEFRSELPKSQVGKFLRRILVEEEKQKK
ncbi:MAG: long-chain fatty acid--CoA ligase, partial [Thermodesulfobacteriota bacterium]|nr:long-chain fatty acid--CoA ligase [Thermodesulfobacteriota bacterium]